MHKSLLSQLAILLACLLLLSGCVSADAAAWEEMFDLGVRYLDQGNYQEAILMFDAALEINPNLSMAYIHRADAYVGLAQTEEDPAKQEEYLNQAEEDYKKAAETDPEIQDVVDEKTDQLDQIRDNIPKQTEAATVPTVPETQPVETTLETVPETTEETVPETTQKPTYPPAPPPPPQEYIPETTSPPPSEPAETAAPAETQAPEIVPVAPFEPPISVSPIFPDGGCLVAKPVIYLYPQVQTRVRITLDYSGTLTASYPHYNGGWEVIAHPDGTLTLPGSDREFYCLFWEGADGPSYNCQEGFVVAGDETAAFLERTLHTLGLTDKEANEFIIYWLPQMEENAYNLITFQRECYTDYARLDIDPEPDSLLRIFMAWKPLDAPISIPEPELSTFQRSGFTVVEWGGTRVSD